MCKLTLPSPIDNLAPANAVGRSGFASASPSFKTALKTKNGASMSKKQLVILGAAGLLLLAAGGALAATLPPDKVTAEDKVMGSASAPVTMIEYYAQACSVCAHFDRAVFPQLKAKYIDTGKVRYVMRLFPLFPEDGPSYKLTRCVPPENYFKAVDVMFRDQPQWDSAEFPGVDAKAGLMKMAHVLGLNDAQALACMNSQEKDDAINRIA